VCWVADHWDDVLSDWSAIHRTDEEQIDSMTAREFWPRTVRLVHYQGATRDVAMTEYRKAQAPQQESETPEPVSAELVDPTPAQIRALRDAARRKRFPAAKFGDTNYVGEDEIVKEASRSA
jgi:hypothetical protein